MQNHNFQDLRDFFGNKGMRTTMLRKGIKKKAFFDKRGSFVNGPLL
jgi:hypothetical protein